MYREVSPVTRSNVIFISLLCLAAAASVCANWIERGWCWMPLEAQETPIAEEHTLLACGEASDVTLQLFLSDRRASELTPGGADVPPPVDPAGELKFGQARLGTGGTRYALELDGVRHGLRLLLVADAQTAGAKPQDAAKELLAASRFLGRPETGERGVLLECRTAVLALPARAAPLGCERWIAHSEFSVTRNFGSSW